MGSRVARVFGVTDNEPAIVDAVSVAVVPAERPQIGYRTVAVEASVRGNVGGK